MLTPMATSIGRAEGCPRHHAQIQSPMTQAMVRLSQAIIAVMLGCPVAAMTA
jgi:hypothetical protein